MVWTPLKVKNDELVSFMSQIHVVPNNNQKIQSEKSEADNENTLEEFKD